VVWDQSAPVLIHADFGGHTNRSPCLRTQRGNFLLIATCSGGNQQGSMQTADRDVRTA
jgi:hypothetical protein